MDQFSKDFGGLHSPDDFDLLSLGLVPGQEVCQEEPDDDAVESCKALGKALA